MKIYVCQICGHLAFNELQEKCPVCGAEKKDFKQNDNIFKESKEKSPEADAKHVPSVVVAKQCGLIPEEGCNDIHIRIGKTLHPMEEKHFIQFIDTYHENKFISRTHLTPFGVNPATAVHCKKSSGAITIVENCNIHGYWKADVSL